MSFLVYKFQHRKCLFTLSLYSLQSFSHVGVFLLCPTLAGPANGAVIHTGVLPGATATYTCDMLYELVGNDTRVCDSNGIWTNSAPTCARKSLVHFSVQSDYIDDYYTMYFCSHCGHHHALELYYQM
jgi:hypothetical protein